MKTKKHKMVLIEWRDSANIANRWTGTKETIRRGAKDFLISSVGFVIGETRDYLTITRCMDDQRSGRNVNGALQIPRACIQSIDELAKRK